MKKPSFAAVVTALTCLCVSMASAQARNAFGKANPFNVDELPAGQLKAQLQALPPQERGKAMKWLHTFDFSAFDAAQHLRADKDGGIFIVCPDSHGNCKGHVDGPEKQDGPSEESRPTEDISGNSTTSASTPIAFAAVPVSSPPAYHSRPAATRRIYLDFNGAYVSGKAWSESDGTTTGTELPPGTNAFNGRSELIPPKYSSEFMNS